jgi:hypothetical protein
MKITSKKAVFRRALITLAIFAVFACKAAGVGGNSGGEPASGSRKVETPAATLRGGSYAGTQNVSLLSATKGAKIYYTLDGNNPTRSSALYSGPVEVAMNTTLKAVAVMENMTDSDVMSELYTLQETVAAPQANPPAGLYAASRDVQLSSDTAGAVIWYTLGSGDPDIMSGATMPVTVAPGCTLKAVAKKDGMIDSALLIADYVQMKKVATPAAEPGTGEYAGPQNVSFTSPVGATIWYTLDGSDPAGSGTRFQYSSGTFSMAMGQTLRAIATKPDWIDSDELSAAYTLMGTVASPVPTPGAGAILSNQTITLTSSTVGAAIRYTIDGGDPTDSTGTVYADASPIPASEVIGHTLRAIAVKVGLISSPVTVADYTHQKAAMPEATPADNPASITSKSVTLSSPDGGIIKYTLDGTTIPGASVGTIYSQALTMDATSTLKAIAIVPDYADSDVLSRTYTIKVATPTSTVPSNTYTSAQSVDLGITTPGAEIRYTIGTTPSEPTGASPEWPSSPVTVSESKTIKAKAFKSGLLSSDTLTLLYTINMVTAVSVSPAAETVIRGTSRAFTATPAYTGNPQTTVTWDVSGGSASTIDTSTGILTVPVSETASSLVVTATSTANPGASGTATVTVSDLYSQTGSGPYTWEVPVTGDYEIELTGASGGSGNGAGGKGGIITGTISLAAGTTYTINVGGVGANGIAGGSEAAGGYNGGGNGGKGLNTYNGGGGGGGASDIRTVGGDWTTRMMVAGGGGGGAKAVGGGGVTGGNAGNGNGGNGANGGNGGAGATMTGVYATGVGGNGASTGYGDEGGAGGGGGYYGAGATGRGKAGGGGSSWADTGAGMFTNVTAAADGGGTNSGNGKVRINKLP